MRVLLAAGAVAGAPACAPVHWRDPESRVETQAQAWERREDAGNARQRCHVRAQAEEARGIERRRPPECDR